MIQHWQKVFFAGMLASQKQRFMFVLFMRVSYMSRTVLGIKEKCSKYIVQ